VQNSTAIEIINYKKNNGIYKYIKGYLVLDVGTHVLKFWKIIYLKYS
jgi:hypothetical protein